MSKVKFCLFASSPDMQQLNFVVKVLTGTPEELGRKATAWGYDGIEFMPDPTHTPDPELFKKKIEGFKRILDFAGYFKARVGLGAARGKGIPGMSKDDMTNLTEEILRELTEHAEKAGTIIMLEPAEAEYTDLFNTNEEVMAMVAKIGSPNFSIMLDTHQLYVVEPSIEHGIRAAKGQARHIHLYEPSRLPPGVSTEKETLDWPNIARVLKEEGFEGSASVVIVPQGDPEPIARKSVAYLKELLKDNS